MLLKIKLNSAKIIKADEHGITLGMEKAEHPIILTTHYLEGKPELQRADIFVSHHGRIQKA